jgi:beta-barrel assembly-enhancing protease
VRHQAELLPAPGGFRLVYDESNCDFYSWSDLQFGEVRGADSIYLLKGRRGWRIGVEGPPPAEIASFLPKGARYGRWIDRIGLWPATSAFVALSAAVVFIVVKTPDVLAPMIPMAWEQKLGDAMIGALQAAGPQGRAARYSNRQYQYGQCGRAARREYHHLSRASSGGQIA